MLSIRRAGAISTALPHTLLTDTPADGSWLRSRVRIVFAFYVPTGERKRPVLHFMRDLAPQFLSRPTLLIGDFNTGIPQVDEHGAELTCSAGIRRSARRRWVDLYRMRNPESRERSFYERPSLGYRIDDALRSPPFNELVRDIYYSHQERFAGISDHSSIHVLVDRPRASR